MPQLPSRNDFPPSHIETLSECPYCHSSSAEFLFRENGFTYVECTECTLIYLKNRIRREYVAEIYDRNGYHVTTDTSYLVRTAEKRLMLLGRLSAGTRILEDGAGSGAFVAVCRKKGLDAVGCDLGMDAFRAATREFGIELHRGTLESLHLGKGSFDVVASFNLLSHIYEPWAYAREVERVLAHGGRWLVRTGDRTGWRKKVGWGRWSAPEHVYHFTAKIFEKIINDVGMRIEWKRPAFDSDYPYILWRIVEIAPTKWKSIFLRMAGGIHYVWTKAHLPREDVYFLARKTS
jgi:SAM-dependent methyltransferase